MSRRKVFIVSLLQVVLASVAFAQTTQITNGLNYFISTQIIDSSWG